MWWHSFMHHSDDTNTAILHHYDDVDLLYRCNVFVFLFIVSGLSSFKLYKNTIFQGTHVSGCF